MTEFGQCMSTLETSEYFEEMKLEFLKTGNCVHIMQT